MQRDSQLFRTPLESNRSPYVVGIDASLTSTGVYFLSVNNNEEAPDFYYTVPTNNKKLTEAQRIDHIFSVITDDIRYSLYPVIAACIEDYGPVNRFAGKLTVRAELCGNIKHFLRNDARVPYFLVAPKALKLYAAGNGNAEKSDMLDRAAQYGLLTSVSDVADAFFCARFAKDIVTGNSVNSAYTRVNPTGFAFT